MATVLSEGRNLFLTVNEAGFSPEGVRLDMTGPNTTSPFRKKFSGWRTTLPQ